MTDRELLELAANAADVEIATWGDDDTPYIEAPSEMQDFTRLVYWNPLTDDGDAFRLAAKLEIDILFRRVGGQRVESVSAGRPTFGVYYGGGGRDAATRRAIVLAAAEIGKAMKP